MCAVHIYLSLSLHEERNNIHFLVVARIKLDYFTKAFSTVPGRLKGLKSFLLSIGVTCWVFNPKIHSWNPNFEKWSCQDVEPLGVLRLWIGLVPFWKSPAEPCFPFCHASLQQKDGHLKKQVLNRNWICWCHDFELPNSRSKHKPLVYGNFLVAAETDQDNSC